MKEWKQFCIKAHGDQKRKYTNDPYYFHLENVNELFRRYSTFNEIYKYAAYGHDLLEDTDESAMSIISFLHNNLGYDVEDSFLITNTIQELTDIYTKENYPSLNRAKRKELEAYRLWSISPEAQTIKYADLIDNLKDIVPHDKDFGRVYVYEKEFILQGMNKGDKILYDLAKQELESAKLLL